MKILLIILSLSFFINDLLAQEIKIQYKDDTQVKSSQISIGNDTKFITIKGVTALTVLSVEVSSLPNKNKVIFKDFSGDEFGTIDKADTKRDITAKTPLNNTTVTIVHQDEKGDMKIFAVFSILEELPSATINIVTPFIKYIGPLKNVCDLCGYKNNSIVYDYSKNKLSYNKNAKWSCGRPIVGQPFSFIVKNINPFRDSVIISSETIDYNPEVPALFNKAFFEANLVGTSDNNILADVFALGKQIEQIKSELKNAKECVDVCAIIQNTKNTVEQHFTKFQFDPQKKDLVIFLAEELQGVQKIYRDSVANILNSYRTFYYARNYFIYNVPQVRNADEYIFNLSVLPKKGAQSAVVVDHQPVSVHTVGGFKVDFSSGLFVSNLRDERYNFIPDSSVILNSYGGDSIVYNRRAQIIRQSEKKKLDFGVAALMHFYPRISPSINIGLTLGAGLSVGPNPAIRYLGGGSLLLGRSGRLIISYGCAAGFVDVLTDGYQDRQYVTAGRDIKSITKKIFKTNSFWSVTFNIPLFKSKVKANESKEEEPTQEKKGEESGGNKEADK